MRERFQALAAIGKTPGGGVTRLAFSPAALQAHRLAARWMEEAGLRVRDDAAGNLIGRREGTGPAIVIGSHLDTVPDGGAFDGALGVVAGLEVVQRLVEEKRGDASPLEIVAHADEEGSHHAGTFGSRAMLGEVGEEDLLGHQPGREPLAAVMRGAGLEPTRIGQARRERTGLRAYFELHIEQGPVLESLGIPVGIVTSIVGIDQYLVRVPGQARHAGTTPVAARDDALVKAARAIQVIREFLLMRPADLIGNVGSVSVSPGAMNVVPAEAILSVEFRSARASSLDEAGNWLVSLVAEHPGATVRRTLREHGCPMSAELTALLESVARSLGIATHQMPSGAGHDAQVWGRHVPAAMLFVPSRGGISHSPEEWTDWEDVIPGADVLLNAVAALATAD
ncbi:MAG: Zn-dependent hydrolase [bacterium]|nr:Zn-dependent hydrolase [bacterium]